LSDLEEAARLDGIGAMSEIEFAVLETDRQFSIIKRATPKS
jgi:uncharacterized membrane protein YcaP (DUF421 family)